MVHRCGLEGNGRVGRLLVGLLLCEWGLLPQPLLNLSAYIERYRQNVYDHLLVVSQEGDWETWLRFFLRGVSEQARDGLVRMERLQAIRIKYQSTVDIDRNPQRMSAVVDFFCSPVRSCLSGRHQMGWVFLSKIRYQLAL